VTLAQNNRVVVVFPDRTQDDLRDLNRNRINFQQPEGIATDSLGNLFVGDTQGGNNGRVDKVDAVLTTTRGFIDQGANPGRMSMDESGAVPLLCIPFRNLNEVQCWAGVDTPTPTKLLTLDQPNDGIQQPIAVTLDAGTLWILEQGCVVKQTSLTYDAVTPSVTAAAVATVTPATALSGTCLDIVALPSGDVAIADNGAGSVVRMTPAGDLTDIATGLPDVVGLDFSGGALFVLDARLQTLFKITGAF
jgi:DNA-binding beta-propeller fold protein YncE